MDNRRTAMVALSDLIHHYHAWYSEGLRQIDLTPVRARALYGLFAEGPQRQHALSAIAGCSPQQMNGILEALESRGWVVRNPDPQDGRATSISLTTSGWELARLIDTLRADAVIDLFGSINDEQVDQFIDIAGQLLDNMSKTTMSIESAQERADTARESSRSWGVNRS